MIPVVDHMALVDLAANQVLEASSAVTAAEYAAAGVAVRAGRCALWLLIGGLYAPRQRIESLHREHDTAVGHGHAVAIDCVVNLADLAVFAKRLVQVHDELVPEQIEVDPVIAAAPFGATERTLGKG